MGEVGQWVVREGVRHKKTTVLSYMILICICVFITPPPIQVPDQGGTPGAKDMSIMQALTCLRSCFEG